MGALFDEVKENLTMAQVARHFGYEPNRAGFIHSPFSEDRTASCKLYRNSFFDFSTNTGGDLIRFTAILMGQNDWTACKYLVEAFALPLSLAGHIDNREQIERRKRERQRQQERQQEFKSCLLYEINSLKQQVDTYRAAIEKMLYKPFSDMWRYCINELQKTEYKLDILCASDQESYRRLKPDKATGLSSDRPQWLLDTLSILADDGVFQATEDEIAKIKRQRDFELNRRPENRGEVKRTQGRENLQQMSNSDLIALLGNLIGET